MSLPAILMDGILILILILHAFIFAHKIKEGQIIKVEIFESEAQNHRECAQALACANQYGFRFVRVKAQTVMNEPDAGSVQAGF